ncbi:DUF6241 domain-containing protein [Niallia taxi]|uniref:DUF6241 domain-containing protein n=1 Tax=Niallia taxi TaxID=2499688 RepID=UPI003D2D0243
MKKTAKWTIGISFFAMLGIWTVLFWDWFMGEDIETTPETSQTTNGIIPTGTYKTEEGEVLDQIIVGERSSGDWVQKKVLDTMHKMTHQKVIASEKWGAVEMTEDRVNELYAIVEGSDFYKKDFILSILDKWKVGDFKTIDEDHNAIWNTQEGNVGKARGLMTEEQEKEYIKKVFK